MNKSSTWRCSPFFSPIANHISLYYLPEKYNSDLKKVPNHLSSAFIFHWYWILQNLFARLINLCSKFQIFNIQIPENFFSKMLKARNADDFLHFDFQIRIAYSNIASSPLGLVVDRTKQNLFGSKSFIKPKEKNNILSYSLWDSVPIRYGCGYVWSLQNIYTNIKMLLYRIYVHFTRPGVYHALGFYPNFNSDLSL